MNTTHAYMLNKYTAHSATHNYIIGVEQDGIVYACYHTDTILPYITMMSQASRGKGASIRYRPNRKQKKLILDTALATFPLCTLETLEDEATRHGKQSNKGVAFEALIARHYGKDYRKDSVDFTKQGDIEIDGKQYQIKYEQATLCTAQQIDRLQ